MKIEVLPPAQQRAGTTAPSTRSIETNGVSPVPTSGLPGKSIEIVNTMFLRGPSMWTYRPILEAWIDIGELENFPSNKIPGLYERLTAWLPTLIEHRCGIGERGGFLQRLREGTWAGHILEHVMIELQNLAGIPAGFGKARQTSKFGVYKVVVRTTNAAFGHAVLYAARDLVMAAIEGRPYDVTAVVEQLRADADTSRLGSSAACIVGAADDRRIPVMRFEEGTLVQLGYGARQRRLWAADEIQTGAIAESIASDQELSRSMLQSCAVPVPEGRAVESAEQAWEAAQDLGLPVIVKIADAGYGAVTGLSERAEIESAYAAAAAIDSDVVVERLVPGSLYRLLIVGGRLASAIRLEGNTSSDITDLVHPDVVATAALAARIVGLDIAGVDLIAQDIARPLEEQQGAVVNIDARPGLLAHAQPDHGEARPVGHAVVDHLFPAPDHGRIPVVGVAGSRGTTAVARLLSRLLQTEGKSVGLACGDGLYLNQRQVERGDCANWESARRVLLNRAVEAAVIENSNRAILSEGLAYDRCQVGVVTSIDPAAILPEYFIDDAEQIAKVVRTQVDVVLPDGVAVLNAADRRVAELAPLCDGEVLFFAPRPDIPALVEHRSRNGRAVFVRHGRVVLAAGAEETAILAISPMHSNQLEALLATAGAAWALGLPPQAIGAGLQSFIAEFRPLANVTSIANARSHKRKIVNGNLKNPGIARSQSLEPADGDRSYCGLC